MTWQTVTDVNDGGSFGGAAWQTAIDAIEELQTAVGSDETVDVALWERGTYTPTLTNTTLTDGTNSARYAFVGGESSSDYGLMFIYGAVILGTSGAFTGLPTFSIPTGFTLDVDASTFSPVGQWGGTCAGSNYSGVLGVSAGAASVHPNILGASATYTTLLNISGSIPGTWTSSNFIRWRVACGAVRT